MAGTRSADEGLDGLRDPGYPRGERMITDI